MKPLYKHDCPNCNFLGVYKGKDLYICGKQAVVRHSSEPSDNSTMDLPEGHIEGYYKEVLIRALQNKFLTLTLTDRYI